MVDNSYKRVKTYRKLLKKERDIYINAMIKINNLKVVDHLRTGGLDRFRILKRNDYTIGAAYIQDLAMYMVKHHKIHDINYYIDKYSKELLNEI